MTYIYGDCEYESYQELESQADREFDAALRRGALEMFRRDVEVLNDALRLAEKCQGSDLRPETRSSVRQIVACIE